LEKQKGKIKIPNAVLFLEKLINEKLKDKLQPGEIIVVCTFIKGGVHFWIYPKTADLRLVEKVLGTSAMHTKQVIEITEARLEEMKANKMRAIYVV